MTGGGAARSVVLSRIRRALDGAGSPPAAVDVDRAYRREDTRTEDERLALLAERLEEYRATVHRCDEGAVGATVRRICADHDAATVVVPADLPDALRPAGGVTAVVDDGHSAQQLDEVDGVVTGCAVAIAETGTIVLDGGAGQGRRAITLVPDLHICVVPADRVVALVPEAITALAEAAADGRPLTLISGPSATSDIELSRVEGVHGPRRLEVILAG